MGGLTTAHDSRNSWNSFSHQELNSKLDPILNLGDNKINKKKSCGSTAASPILAGWSSALNQKSDEVVVFERTISLAAHKSALSDSTS
ncbi:hypothetical protein Zmor_015045 [Zophobas morio]|uniref:Uncharacterized protein n=1 Tax=Zophobas morio TaxID=2755281 RepID=A0AA38IIJ2_9CUCU|nr:hypothetical protein Zmor_015045 [Zophobas morio]